MTNGLKVQNLWAESKYYLKISQKEDFSHPGYLLIQKFAKNSTRILDVGCGDGSKLSRLGNNNTLRVGCELSQTGVKLGNKKFHQIFFTRSSGESLPFNDNTFDITTCLYVLEHTSKPEKIIKEIIRVTKNKGLFFFMAPNFGAPNRASPNNQDSRYKKLIIGLIKDIFINKPELKWHKVESKKISIEEFARDDDTTVEPYLRSLLLFLRKFPVKIVSANSFWDQELDNPNKIQIVFKKFSRLGIYPLEYWGPHLFVAGRKL